MKSPEICDSIDHITGSAVEKTGIRVIPPPAILIVVRGMILARTIPVGVTTVPVTINQDMKALLSRRELDPVYMRQVLVGLQDAMRMLVEESGHGTRVLRTDLLRNLSLPIPPLAEQKQINGTITRVTTTTDGAIDRARREIDLLREYRTRLIADVVTGKLDVRKAAANLPDESDEPEPLDEAGDLMDSDEDMADDLDAIPEEAEA